MVSWPRGLRRSPAKGVYNKIVSRVQIPHSPNLCNASVAQLDRVLGYEPSGQRFESSRMRQYKTFYYSNSDIKKNILNTMLLI